MIDQIAHDRIIAKLQHFADHMHQRVMEKESLSVAINDKILRSEIRNEILIYQEIIDEYHGEFKDIIVWGL